jgi:hypothetical protein
MHIVSRSADWMRTTLLALGVAALAACGGQAPDGATAGPTGADAMQQDPPMLGITWTREESARLAAEEAALDAQAGSTSSARRTPNMTYHKGKIMTTAVSKAIFWGPSWANSAFVGDKITGLDAWYTGHSGSNYAKTCNEYTDTLNGGHQVGSTLTHQGHVIDTSTAAGGGSTSTILAEVCKQITAGSIVPDAAGNGYYPVYSDVKRGNAGYCAWHSAGTCNGQLVQFAFFFNLDGDPGCDPADTTTGHSQGLAALANVTGHEIEEARTDPASPGAWYDQQGAENGDKCAWTWGAPLVTFSNGSKWKVQGEWSNAAYTAGTGYPNRSGQKGCLGGN